MRKYKADGKPVRILIAFSRTFGWAELPNYGETLAAFRNRCRMWHLHRATLTIDAPKPAKRGKVKRV